MATQRVVLDARGNNILSLFENNMAELGALNQLAASTKDVGVYHGPDKDVNINYPRDGTSYNRMGREPGPYESYHVREITLNQNIMTSENPQYNPGMVTKEQNDGKGGVGHIAQEKTETSFHGKSNTTLLHDYGAYSNESGRADPSMFMELKGRKSLFTLLQETRAAFFDNKDRPVYRNPTPGWWRSSTNQSNEYGDNYESYDYQYMDNQGRNFVDPPQGIDFTIQALVGFNLGQTLGGNVTIEDRIKTEAQNITRSLLLNLGAAAGAEENQYIADYYNRLVGAIVPIERISQLYVPGWGRPAENWLTKKPLSENLNQNILLPPNSGELGGMNPTDVPGNTNNNGSGGPGFGLTEKTFQSLYTRNRAGQAGGVNIANPVFNNGMIAGTPINLLQEPGHITTKQIEAQDPPPATVSVPFTFEEDDAKYLTYPKRETGFTSNSDRTTIDPSRLQVAVRDYSAMSQDDPPKPYHLGDSTVKLTQGQYFPFAFSTVNKRRGAALRLQVCYLQAIINSLGESYTPTWNSRHFFGRSEQAHTYTFTDRAIDISFTIFANEMRQLQNVYERVVWLAQQCYPDYAMEGRMLEGPIIAMRVGDLFQYKAGIIRSLSYDWMFGGGKWELTSGMRMPQGVTVTMNYQVIHENTPSRDTDFYGGPAGGLNSATERYRTIHDPKLGPAGNAFDAFEDTEGSSLGFGHRLIDAGVLAGDLDETSFIKSVKEANMAWMMGENAMHDERAQNLSVPGAGTQTAGMDMGSAEDLFDQSARG